MLGPRIPLVVCAAALLLAAPTCVTAGSRSETNPGEATGPGDPQELAQFMDGFMAGHLAQLHAPGAAVVVVKDGQILLAKGYGYADLEQRRPFTAATAFRVKSVSKTFTAAAVMQLSEERRVDLRAPVRSYLNGFRLPDGNAPAINLDQLLTQTSGIGDRAVGTLTPDRIAAADLRTYLAANMPPRIASPGTVFSYTDHGISLAGLVVEQVSGQPFARYMHDRIFGPLGMDHSAFDPALHGQVDRAVGYQRVGGSYRRAPVGYFHVGPAVSLVTTAADMGQFLVAMLHRSTAEHSLLRPETIQLMEARHFALQPAGPGVAYGLYEWPQNAERVLLHGGLGHGFSSLLALLPERHVGFVIATNSDEPDLRWAFLRSFIDRYYPATHAAPKAIADSDLGRFAGAYGDYRYEGRIEVLKELLSQGQITAYPDRTISLSWTPGRWVQVAPLVFRNRDDPNKEVAFQAQAGGPVTRVLGGDHPDDGLVKLPWFSTLPFFGVGVLFFAALFLSACVVWLASSVRRLRRKAGAVPFQHAMTLGGVIALLNLVFLLGIPILLLPYAGLNGTELDFGVPLSIQLVFVVPLVTVVLALPLAVTAFQLWRTRSWGLWPRAHFTVVAAGSLLFPVFLSYWKLFGLA
ncbi:MAG: beta-lactamase family protein [Chloroflexi bacterium]|nr:MAG: beta-lactamase family protein [Chloroflexota bacterium]